MSIAGFLKGLCVILVPVMSVESMKEAVCKDCDCLSCQNLVRKRRWFASPLLLMIILGKRKYWERGMDDERPLLYFFQER